MEFGIHFQVNCADWQSPQQRYQDTLDFIQLGDELGYDHAWFAEMHFDPRHCITPSPIMLAAAAAQRTKRIRLGIAVSLLPLHNPIRVAEDIATLDLLSNGRAEFGVGRGARPYDYEGYHIPIEESRERLVESLKFITTGWASDRFSFEGKYFSAQDLSLVPKPIQKPHPRIRVASNSPDTFELVGNMGYDLFASTTVLTMERLQDGIARYRRALRTNGRSSDGRNVVLQMPTYVAERAEDSRAAAEPSITHYIGVLREGYDNPETVRLAATNPGVAQLRERFGSMTYDIWSEQVGIYGDPEMCANRIRALHQELDLGGITCMFNSGGLVEPSKVKDAMRLFATEVMPHFR